MELGWLKRVSDSRALQLTSSGKAGLSEIFQIEINNEGSQPVDYATHDDLRLRLSEGSFAQMLEVSVCRSVATFMCLTA